MSKTTPMGSNWTSVQKVRIPTDSDGQRLDNWLMAQFRKLPRSAIYRLLRKGEVRVNGGRKKAEYRLREGDEVRLPPVQLPTTQEPIRPTAKQTAVLSGRVLLEDENYLAINKPEGWAVHGGSGVNLGLIEALRQSREEPNLELAHRIDRDTSGVLLIARRRRALRVAHEAFRLSKARKRYLVVVQGQWPQHLRKVQQPLSRYLTADGERRVKVDPDGKASRTDIEILQTAPHATLLAVFPHTGRTHQIRVHCADAGHPVVGDLKYGSDQQQSSWQRLGVRRLGLHAQRLRLNLHQLADSSNTGSQNQPPPLEDLDVQCAAGETFDRLWGLMGGEGRLE